MTLAPVRDLGSDGVLTDVDPYSSTIKQFSMAVNARFEDKKITRGPVFLNAGNLVTASTPAYALSYKQLSGTYKFHVCTTDGRVVDWSSGGIGAASNESDISIAGYTPGSYSSPYTSCIINDVVYVNRPDRVPWFKLKGDTQFSVLPNAGGLGWDSTWRCMALREVAGVLVAINVTKGATAYPTMVKTSDYMVWDTAPAQWVSSTTNSATENILPDLQEPLIDGLPLRDRMILYAEHETWLMEPRYDSLMFNYRRLFSSFGMISQNCGVEVNNIHYVFGSTDIWKHDGFSETSLAAGKVRDFIYDNMQKNMSNLFFTQYNVRLNEVLFCYVSTDPYCAFPVGGAIGYPGCNRAAVFNLRSGAWYFYDLPYVTAMSMGIPYAGTTYTGMGTNTYTQLGGATYSSFGTVGIPGLLAVAPSVTGSFGGYVGTQTLAAAVRSFERYGSPAANGVVDTVANQTVYIENDGIDLDDFQESLRQYKVIKTMYPECRMMSGAAYMYFSWGSSDYASSPPPAYGTPQSYDGNVLYKLDTTVSGRYLSLKITYNDIHDFQLSGFDFEFQTTGAR